MSDICRKFALVMLAMLVASCAAPATTLSPIATTIATPVAPVVSDTPESLPPVSIVRYPMPAEQKIRVLSIAVGWGPESKGYEEVMAALKEAKAANIFVLNTSLFHTHGLNFHGLGRNPLSCQPDRDRRLRVLPSGRLELGHSLPGRNVYAGRSGQTRYYT